MALYPTRYKERDKFGDLEIDEKIILKCTLSK
jgi:hypothetical protein